MLLLQRGRLLKGRGRWIQRGRCDGGRVPGRRGDAVGARRVREGGMSGRSGGVGGFVAGEMMVAFVAEAAVVEVIRMMGAGAVGMGRMVGGKIIVHVGAVE